MATLAVLEEALTGFSGAVLLVSHDRYFLDQVATTILAFDGAGGDPGEGEASGVVPFASLAQWEAWRAERQAASSPRAASGRGTPSPSTAPAAEAVTKRRLSYLDQREYDVIEKTIAKAEATLHSAISDSERPENASDAARLVALLQKVADRRAEVDQLYARWAELEAKRDGAAEA
jgi:ATP-binding cassette subfamily F protein uup